MSRFIMSRRFIAAVFLVIGIVGWLLPDVPVPRLALFGPILYALAIVADLTTALVLLSGRRAEPLRHSMIFLGFGYAAAAVTLFLTVLFLPLLPETAPIVVATPHLGTWLFLSWHVCVALGTLVYVLLRRFEGTPIPNVRYRIVVCLGLLLAAGLSTFVAAHFAGHVPLIENGSAAPDAVHFLTGSIVLGLLALATFCVYRLREPSSIEHAITYSLLALTLSFLLFLAGGFQYSAGFYVGRFFVAAGSFVVLTTALRALIASRARLGPVERELGQVASESAKRAGRIRAVSRIAAVSNGAEAERNTAMLQLATNAMRPGKAMLGMLTHAEGETIVVDATAWSEFGPEGPAIAATVFPGAVYPVEQTMAIRLRGRGRATAWNDLSSERAEMIYAQQRLGSFIGAPVAAPGPERFVAFVSPSTMADEPFAEDDLAYVDVIAALFAARFRQQAQAQRIAFQVEHDALTGLESRAMFLAEMAKEIAADAPFAIAFVDLDGFRHINRRYGHQFGDELLVEVGVGLRRVGEGDLAARMNSDEFAVLIRGAGSRTEAEAALARYAALFADPFPTGDRTGTHVIAVGASIGAARFPADGTVVDEILRRAHVALDVAKDAGGSATTLFEEPMEAMLAATWSRIVEFRTALEREEFAMVYQPTFALATGELTGAEALVRWNHPERGEVGPDDFIPFAERNGLIAPLTMWVFARVAHDVASLGGDLPAGFRVYFNVGASMLDDVPFISAVNARLALEPALAQHLGVEVTESAAMQNIDRSMSTIALFRRWGLAVAIDDFGTGHSSLTYLKRLTVDLVKIDRSFVAGVPGDSREARVTDLILHLIGRFGFATIAEGIETRAQADWLLAHGCTSGQGFYLGRPAPLADLRARLAEARRALRRERVS